MALVRTDPSSLRNEGAAISKEDESAWPGYCRLVLDRLSRRDIDEEGQAQVFGPQPNNHGRTLYSLRCRLPHPVSGGSLRRAGREAILGVGGQKKILDATCTWMLHSDTCCSDRRRRRHLRVHATQTTAATVVRFAIDLLLLMSQALLAWESAQYDGKDKILSTTWRYALA